MPIPPPTVVCVDDEPIVLDSLRDQFERHLGDCEIEVAQDALEALELLTELKNDGVTVPVVVSDQIMPGMKGDELLVRVHDLLPETRTILLTGQAGLDAVGRAVNDAGLYRYISKPWDPDDLTLTVREAIRSFTAEEEVRRKQAQLTAAHAAAMRFVPFEFLSLLGRSELADVKRGDHVKQPVSVYYSDIRSYTTLVEGHSPGENLRWINEYLAWMDGPIHRHGGFVEGITGDAILALFGTGADALVQAAIDSRAALAEYNAARGRRGDPPLEIGIGLNHGEALLGVIGGRDRLKCGVIGDAANLAARVEGLTKRLGATLLTGQTRDALVDPGRYALRYVDRVRVKGMESSTRLYEVLDALDAAERDRKLASVPRFSEALGHLERGDLVGARAGFEALRSADPTDLAVGWHLARIDRLERGGMPADWDGVTRLTEK